MFLVLEIKWQVGKIVHVICAREIPYHSYKKFSTTWRFHKIVTTELHYVLCVLSCALDIHKEFFVKVLCIMRVQLDTLCHMSNVSLLRIVCSFVMSWCVGRRIESIVYKSGVQLSFSCIFTNTNKFESS